MRLVGFASLVLLSSSLVLAQRTAPSASQTGLSRAEAKEGFVSLFDGKSLGGWQGAKENYAVEDGVLVCKPKHSTRLYTAKEYRDFVFRFEFRQQPDTQGNNGIGLRAQVNGRHQEIQIFNDFHPRSKTLKPYQFCGSVYGLVPAKRGHLNPPGRWNSEEISCQGNHVKVTLNGALIVDADLSKADEHGQAHPMREEGCVALLGHSDRVEFRNLRIKELQ